MTSTNSRGLGINQDQVAVNLRGVARVRAAMHPVRSLEQISAALTDACQVRDAYQDALAARVMAAQDQEQAGALSTALHAGAQVAAGAVQLKAAQDLVNRLLAEFQATAEGIR